MSIFESVHFVLEKIADFFSSTMTSTFVDLILFWLKNLSCFFPLLQRRGDNRQFGYQIPNPDIHNNITWRSCD